MLAFDDVFDTSGETVKLQNTSVKVITWTRPRFECGACHIRP